MYTRGLEAIDLVPAARLRDVVVACGLSLDAWLVDDPYARASGLALTVNPAESEGERVFVMVGPTGWLAAKEVRPSEDLFAYSLQHLRRFIEPTLALHTRWGLGAAALSEDATVAEAQAREAVGTIHHEALTDMATLWWRRERYAVAMEAGPPRSVTDALAIVEAVEREPVPLAIVGLAAPHIVAMGETLIGNLLGVRFDAAV